MLFPSKKNTFFIEEWEVDPLHNKICCGSEQRDVEPKAMQILECLARHAGQTVHRDDLFKVVWPNQKVTEEALTRIIGHLRQCFSDAPKSPHYIATIHKIGYRLIAQVSCGNYFKDKSLDNAMVSKHFYFIKAFALATKMAVFSLTTTLIYFVFDQPVTANLAKLEVKYVTNDIGLEMGQALSPDGLNVVYMKFIGGKNSRDSGTDYRSVFFVKNIDSHKVERLPQPEGETSHPVWSPDGAHIAYGNEMNNGQSGLRYGIYSTNVKTGVFTLHATTSTHNHGLTWSPDGQYIIYPDGSNETEARALYRVDVNTNQSERLAPKNIEGEDIIYSYPKFSPDGEYIAVIRTDRNSRKSIELLDTKHYSATSVYNTGVGLSSFEWKDNNKLFVADGSMLAKKLFELSIDTGAIKHIPIEGKDIEYLSYSQITKRLTFESIDQPYNINYLDYSKDYVLSDYAALTSSNKKELEAVESLDGGYTAIISSRDGSFDIWLRQNASKQTHKLTSLQASSMSDVDWSTDNRSLSFVATTEYHDSALYWVDIDSKKIDMFSFKQGQYSLIGWEASDSLLFTSDHKNEWKLWRLNTQTKVLSLASDASISYGRLSPDRKTLYLIKSDALGIWRADIKDINPVKIPGTESVGMNRGWTATEDGLLYFVYGDIAGYDNLYFFEFKTSKTRLITRADGIYLNRINWSNNRLYYVERDERQSDIAMIDNL